MEAIISKCHMFGVGGQNILILKTTTIFFFVNYEKLEGKKRTIIYKFNLRRNVYTQPSNVSRPPIKASMERMIWEHEKVYYTFFWPWTDFSLPNHIFYAFCSCRCVFDCWYIMITIWKINRKSLKIRKGCCEKYNIKRDKIKMFIKK